MILDLVLWIMFGAIAGWITFQLVVFNYERRVIPYLLIGIAGAVFGGWLMRIMETRPDSPFDLSNFLFSAIGALIVLFFYNWVQHQWFQK